MATEQDKKQLEDYIPNYGVHYVSPKQSETKDNDTPGFGIYNVEQPQGMSVDVKTAYPQDKQLNTDEEDSGDEQGQVAGSGYVKRISEPVDAHVVATGVTPQTKENPSDPPYNSYQDLWHTLNPKETLTIDDKKKKRRDTALAAVGDALNAFSHVWYRAGSKPYDYASSLSAANQARWDQIERNRITDNRARADAMTRARQLDMTAMQEERKWQNMLEQQAEASKRADAKDERDDIRLEIAQAKDAREAAKAEVNLELMGNKIDAAEAEARKKKIEADYAEKYGELMGRHSSVSYRSSGGGGGKRAEFRVYDRKGNEHWFVSKDAAEKYAKQEGTYETYGIKKATETKDGRKSKSQTETKDVWVSQPPKQEVPSPKWGSKTDNTDKDDDAEWL